MLLLLLLSLPYLYLDEIDNFRLFQVQLKSYLLHYHSAKNSIHCPYGFFYLVAAWEATTESSWNSVVANDIVVVNSIGYLIVPMIFTV